MLSPIDQLMPRIYTKVFLVYETDEFEKAVTALNSGLAKACSHLPWLRGSVHKSSDRDNSRNRLWLSWSFADPPPAVVVTDTPESVPSFQTLSSDGAPLSVFEDGLAPVPTLISYEDPESRAPAVVIGATRIEGGLILCLCAHHVVMDGTGMGMFLKFLGNCIRDESNDQDDGVPLNPAELHRRQHWLRDATAVPSASLDELLLRHPEYSLRSRSSPSSCITTLVSDQPVDCAAKIFSFSSAKLQEVTQALSRILPAKILTVNNVLGAALWLSITRIRLERMRHDGLEMEPNSLISKLGFAVNARSKVKPIMPNKSYIGNLTMLKVVEFPVPELETIAGSTEANATTIDLSVIAPVITVIAAATSDVTATFVGDTVAFSDQVPDFEDIGPGWNSQHGLDVTYTSWANLGMYECDFGSSLGGKPRFVRIPYMPYIDGMVLALPRRRTMDPSGGKGAERIEVAMMLNERDMQAMEDDAILRSLSA